MDNRRYSSIGHGALPVWNPISIPHLERYLGAIALPKGGAVLDIGCGRGYLLSRIVSKFDVTAVGIDSSPFAIALARRDASAAIAEERLEFVEQTFRPSDYGDGSFDLVICVGATHAVGGYRETLNVARRILRSGGMLLVGDGYWRRPPPGEYLAFLQMRADELSTHAHTQEIGLCEGFDLVASSECSRQEWDNYEEQYARNVEDYVRENPQDPDAASMAERIHAWREAYSRWGRDTLGFGLYLFRI
jgi:cyclopropane fatty-acyl-phospholipid synthase-like methyltransferase